MKREEINRKRRERYKKTAAVPEKREEINRKRREKSLEIFQDPVKKEKKNLTNRRYYESKKFISKISDIASVEKSEVSAIGSEISDSNYKEQFAKLIQEPVAIPKEITLNNENKKTSDYASKPQKNAKMRTHSSADSDGSFLSYIDKLQDFDVNEIIAQGDSSKKPKASNVERLKQRRGQNPNDKSPSR